MKISKDEESDGDPGHGSEIKRPKLSLNLTGLLETDLDSVSFSQEDRAASRSPERKISRDISAKVSIFEALANSDCKEVESKNLWFYRDGLRTPTTPAPASRPSQETPGSDSSNVLPPSPAPAPATDTASIVDSNIVNNNPGPSTTTTTSTPPAVPSKKASSVSSSVPTSLTNKSMPNLLSRPSQPLSLPPPLPPKQVKERSPPPRPLSKELRLEDILSLCAEYERQIEAEKLESLSLSEYEQKAAAESSLCSNGSYASPSSTLQAPRIKTNGSLPRDGKRLPSPCRSLPPTSPLISSLETELLGIFNFEVRPSPGSPVISSNISRLVSSSSQPPASSGSPRTRIRTIVGSAGLGQNNNTSIQENKPTQFSLSDYQGGKEDMADTDKTKEQLYTEAKEILALVGKSPVESPSSTGPRRPPRSKHDSEMDLMPSAEASSRMLIGTVMLSKGSSANLQQSTLEQVKNERIKVLEEVNKNSKELSELSIAIEEAERSVDMETSLLGAEMIGKREEMAGLLSHLSNLKVRESQFDQSLQEHKCANEVEIKKAKQRLEEAERTPDDLENQQNVNMTTDEEMELLEKIKKSHEVLEAERRVFEDLEFKQMEEEASMEAEIEDICKEITGAEKSIEIAEMSMNDMEQETMEMSVNQDISILQEKRENVGRKLEEEKEKLADLELKLRQMLMFGRLESQEGRREGPVVTSVKEEEAEDEEEERWVENNIRPGSLEPCERSPSGESETEVPEVTSPLAARPAGQISQRAGIPTPKQAREVSRPASVETVDTTIWSGDMTDTSSWLGSVTRRDRDRASSRMTGQRPLTRYLPVSTQIDFDLRSHIETAGHQVGTDRDLGAMLLL